MCRFIAYTGTPLLLEELLIKPRNSLIHQSIHAKEAEETLNGDGFGLGWYMSEISPVPGLFISTQPAWNDQNLENITAKIKSSCFFAHVRAASYGDVADFNCHPFKYNELLFMHNGKIGGFLKIKRSIRENLSDELYNWIKGQTDSEHFFALLISNLKKKKRAENNIEDIKNTLQETIEELHTIQIKHSIKDPSYLNFVISNGKFIIALRYISNHNPSDKARTLYYAEADKVYCKDNTCHITKSNHKNNKAVVIASEKLDTSEAEWNSVPENYILEIKEDLSVQLYPWKRVLDLTPNA